VSKRKKKKGPSGAIPSAAERSRSKWPLRIGIGGAFLALVGGLLFIGWGAFSEAKSPRIVVTPPVYDFGRIPRLGGKVTYDVTVENQGEGPLAISAVGFS